MRSLSVKGVGAPNDRRSAYVWILYMTGGIVELYTGIGRPGNDEITFYRCTK